VASGSSAQDPLEVGHRDVERRPFVTH
jgi:hypothetical protein